MPAPTLDDVKAYLGSDHSWTDAQLTSALLAETAAQARRCDVKVDWVEYWPYPDDLAEALFRRIAHNLAVRALPLGVQATVTDAAVANAYVGGTDAEVKRLEAPYRKLVVG